jgi:hypothetical protein
MTRTLRSASAFVAIAAAALPFAGCVLTPNGIEMATRYEGSHASQSTAYTPGNNVHIVSHNGNVTVTAAADSQVGVTFKPFTLGSPDSQGQANAISEMTNLLELDVTNTGGIITIEAQLKPGASGGLGADVEVALPRTFSGAFDVESRNGEVTATVSGTPTSLNVAADNGEVAVTLGAWPTQNSAMKSGTGNLTLSAPASTNGTLSAQASGGTIVDMAIPESWASSVASANSKSYTLNGGGSTLALTTGFGDITLLSY